MKRRAFCIELLSDAAFPASAASTGEGRSRDVVPGSVLLGAVASRLYTQLSEDEAWAVFHSGRVRFGDALPLSPAGARTLPAPRVFHFEKGDSPADGGRLTEAVHNAGRVPLAAGHPWRLLGPGFVGPDLSIVRPAHRGSLRTAMDGQQRARDSFLYHLDGLTRGQRFYFELSAEDGVPDALLARVSSALTGGRIRLGRSHGSEYGRVSIEPAPTQDITRRDLDELALLLLLSELALRDPATGMPTLQPSPAAFGLPDGAFTWDPERSLLRARTYSPFNAHRRAPDLERQVLIAGSVIALKPGSMSIDALRSALEAGLGEHRQEGLGAAVLNPALLSGPHPVAAGARGISAPSAPLADPEDPLLDWLIDQERDRATLDQALEAAQRWAKDLGTWRPPLPKTQWGVVRRRASESSSKSALLEALFDEETGDLVSGVGKLEPRWAARRAGVPRRDHLKVLIEGADEAWAVRAVQLLAGEIVRQRAQEER